MRISTKDLKKLDASIMTEVTDLLRKVKKIDNKPAYGTGYIQSAVIAKLFADLYNDPSSKISSSDTMQVTYKSK